MSDVTLDVYLYFRGTCREAMEFYKDVFGGELTVQTYGDTPDAFPGGVNDETKDRILHAQLAGGDIKMMASDTDKASDVAAKIDLSLGGTDETRLREVFGKLSAGGKVNQPLQKMYWGDTFGSLTDKYGINWMMNISSAN